jgi:L-threonylcarbamoyladenylate synthase
LFNVKGRPEAKPILLIVDSVPMAESVSRPPRNFYAVIEKFWPGPLTLVVPAGPHLSVSVTAGTGTIGLRWPVAPFANTLVRRFGCPITATSANRSGEPATITAGEVRSQLGDSLDVLIDGGALPSRGGSTLLDLTADPPVVLREGPVRYEALEEFFQGRIRRQVA